MIVDDIYRNVLRPLNLISHASGVGNHKHERNVALKSHEAIERRSSCQLIDEVPEENYHLRSANSTFFAPEAKS